MFRIQISGGAPGAAQLVHAYENRPTAERVAGALASYLNRNKLPGYQQGVEVLDAQGHCVWWQVSDSKPRRPTARIDI